MKGKNNYDNYKETGEIELIPDGYHKFKISEKVDKLTDNDDPMVQIKLCCLTPNQEDKWVWDNIIITNPGSSSEKIIGRTKRFLHCIGEPFQGDFDWDSDRWPEKTLIAKIGNEIYNKKPKNKILAYILEDESKEKKSETRQELYNKTKDDLPF